MALLKLVLRVRRTSNIRRPLEEEVTSLSRVVGRDRDDEFRYSSVEIGWAADELARESALIS